MAFQNLPLGIFVEKKQRGTSATLPAVKFTPGNRELPCQIEVVMRAEKLDGVETADGRGHWFGVVESNGSAVDISAAVVENLELQGQACDLAGVRYVLNVVIRHEVPPVLGLCAYCKGHEQSSDRNWAYQTLCLSSHTSSYLFGASF